MIEQVAKLRVELTNELKAAIEAFGKNPEAEQATQKAVQALFKNVELLNDIACRVLEMSIYNRELLQIVSSWIEDQSKLHNATKARLDVFGPPKV